MRLVCYRRHFRMNATCDDVGTFVLIDAQSTILISHNAGPKPTGKLIAPCQTPIWMHSLRPIATRISRFDKWAIANTAPRQHQPSAGRRPRCRVGRLHRFARAIRRPGRDQSADGTRLPHAGGCRKSARILLEPNTALSPRPLLTALIAGVLNVG
jgi:hypothetical protein